jgi:NAD+ synthase (glutamine-hydrolysing)
MGYFTRVAVACPRLSIANIWKNIEIIEEMALQARNEKSRLVLFPELCITGYSCADLFAHSILIKESFEALLVLADRLSKADIVAVVGLPVQHKGRLFNCAAVLNQGRIEGLIPKNYLPNTREYYEQRWFATDLTTNEVDLDYAHGVPFGSNVVFADSTSELVFGIEICEDLWAVIPPSSHMALSGANLILNLSASNETIGKVEYRRQLVMQQSARCQCAYVYSSAGVFESTGDTVYSGHGLIAENGKLLAESERYSLGNQLIFADLDVSILMHDRRLNCSFKSMTKRSIKPLVIDFPKDTPTPEIRRPNPREPFLPISQSDRESAFTDILNIQSTGLARRMISAKLEHAVIGLSGGLDSTWAAIVVATAFKKLNMTTRSISSVTMPGFGTTERTRGNACKLAHQLNFNFLTIDIKDAVTTYLKSIDNSDGVFDSTFENAQARQRTFILMGMANKNKGLVVGTGNLSEAALGWCTFNGDHMSMYHVNIGVPKTVIRALVEWAGKTRYLGLDEILTADILNTPISPELLPVLDGLKAQESESLIGPFDLNDFFIFYFLRYGTKPSKVRFLAQHAFKEKYDATDIDYWLRAFLERFFSQQFKRSVMPEGPKIGSIALSPRADWRMPSEAEGEAWLGELQRAQRV